MAILSSAGWRVVRALVIVVLLAQMALSAQSAPVGEDDVKAAFLYNFAKYVEWPSGSSTGPFVVCVVASGGFVKRVDAIVAGETIEGRPVSRRLPATVEDARSCQILFLERGEASRSGQWLSAVRGAHVLTVGDSPDFLSRGGVVTFVREANRVRFDVNLEEAQKAGLTVSSRLLRVARKVTPPVTP